MDLEEALRFIHTGNWKGGRPGLERMAALMGYLGEPQRELKFIHVAGTNGKGSLCAMLSAILTRAGYRTGLFTSPHLERVHERFRVNGAEISDEDLISLAERVKEAAERLEEAPTEFERLTAMALLHFKQTRCDIVVLEVGLGGRLDATNIIPCPEAAVLMNIGLEHTEVLGRTLAEIAGEKAGIVKPGGTVIAYPGPSEAADVFRAVCRERGAVLRTASMDSLRLLSRGLEGQRFSWGSYQDLRLNLLGPHQVKNAVVALETAALLQEKGWKLSPRNIREGLDGVVWPARMELLSRSPLFLLDGAHNPQCVDAMVNTLTELFPGRKFVFLTGMLADKDYEAMLSPTFPYAGRYLCVTPDSERALPAPELAAWLRGHGQQAEAYGSVDPALREVLALPGETAAVGFGSLYLAGALRGSFRHRLREEQRRAGLRARERLSEEVRKTLSHRIVERILSDEAFRSASCVLSYRAVGGEVDLSELHDAAVRMGKRVVFPRCAGPAAMEALLPSDETAWTAGRYGIPEPLPERSERVSPEEIDLVLCPCTAFDPECRRMGRGGGYYDRYLAGCIGARIVGAAFEAQKVPAVARAPWDRGMERIYTEDAVYTAGAEISDSPAFLLDTLPSFTDIVN